MGVMALQVDVETAGPAALERGRLILDSRCILLVKFRRWHDFQTDHGN